MERGSEVKKLDAALPKHRRRHREKRRPSDPAAREFRRVRDREAALSDSAAPEGEVPARGAAQLGSAAESTVRPSGEMIPLEEVRESSRLTKEKTEKWGALAQTPPPARAPAKI